MLLSPGQGQVKLEPAELSSLAIDLRRAALECRDRGLTNASKWANELLMSIPPQHRIRPKPTPSTSTSQPPPFSKDDLPFTTSTPLHPSRLNSNRSSSLEPNLHASTSTPLSTRNLLRPPRWSVLQTPSTPQGQGGAKAGASGPSGLGSSLLHRKGKPRVSLGDFHDQSARLIDAENEFGYRAGRGGLGEDGFTYDDELDDDPYRKDPLPHPVPEDPMTSPTDPPQPEPELEFESHIELLEEDIYSLAKSYFDSKELERCKRTLQNCRSKKAMFLRLYSVYLIADKKAQEMMPHFMDTKTEIRAITPHIVPILEQLETEEDSYLIYLKGILYNRIGQKDLALHSFIRSLQQNAYNWSAWLSVASCVSATTQFTGLKHLLPSGQMFLFFAVTVMLDLHSATDLMLETVEQLQRNFPTSVHLKAQKALVLYHMRDFESAEKAFDEVRKIDPFRLDEIEIYSNMLYVMGKKAKLGQMAHEYAQVDKNRAEVCCLIGNYYSARDEHIKAIQYFRRSLQLNRDYLPAWTLLGHEFVELKNSHAAIEAYRRAIDVNPKDYRAWYGLGQTYELLDMPNYAIQYYNKATALRPYDCRMWSALACVYENMKRFQDAIQCSNRALLGADPAQTCQILKTLAKLHDNLQNYRQAAEAHRKLIAIAESQNRNPGETAQSYLYAAEYELDMLNRKRDAKDLIEGFPFERQPRPTNGKGISMEGEGVQGNLELAIAWLTKVKDSRAPEKEIAEENLRYITKRVQGGLVAAGGGSG